MNKRILKKSVCLLTIWVFLFSQFAYAGFEDFLELPPTEPRMPTWTGYPQIQSTSPLLGSEEGNSEPTGMWDWLVRNIGHLVKEYIVEPLANLFTSYTPPSQVIPTATPPEPLDSKPNGQQERLISILSELSGITVLKDRDDKIQEILLQWTPSMDLFPVYNELFTKMGHVKFIVIASRYFEKEAEDIKSFEEGERNKYSTKFKFPEPAVVYVTVDELKKFLSKYPNVELIIDESDRELRPWARDTLISAYNHNRNKYTLIPVGAKMQGINALELQISQIVVRIDGEFEPAITAPLDFVGGDVISNGNLTIVGPRTYNWNKGAKSIEVQELIFKKLYGSEKVIIMSDFDARVFPLPDVDSQIVILNDNTVGIGDIEKTYELKGKPKSSMLTIEKEAQVRINSISNWFIGKGLNVIKLPMFIGGQNYVNVLFEGDKVYLPIYEREDESNRYAEEVYKNYGYEVEGIRFLDEVATTGRGSLRCITLVLKRDGYRNR